MVACRSAARCKALVRDRSSFSSTLSFFFAPPMARVWTLPLCRLSARLSGAGATTTALEAPLPPPPQGVDAAIEAAVLASFLRAARAARAATLALANVSFFSLVGGASFVPRSV